MPKRLPKDFTSTPCACGSGEMYSACCRDYHTFKKNPETPERCLRARYSAFAYRIPEFIIESTDVTSGDYMKDKTKWAKYLGKKGMFDGFDFVRLDVGSKSTVTTENALVT